MRWLHRGGLWPRWVHPRPTEISKFCDFSPGRPHLGWRQPAARPSGPPRHAGHGPGGNRGLGPRPGSAKAALRRIYNGSKRAHIFSILCSKSSPQGTPTERSHAAPALGEARVSKKSPMLRDRGVIQKIHFYFVLVLLEAPPPAGKMRLQARLPQNRVRG